MRKIIVLWSLVFLCVFKTSAITGDSLRYLTVKDTVFLELGAYQEKVFTHYIEPGQTLYSLAKFYGMSVGELNYYNPSIKNNVISPNQAIKIPVPNRSVIRFKKQNFVHREHIPVCYKVRKGDTMYKISKRVFEMPIDTILYRNRLETFILQPGQVLQIGWMSIHGIPETYRKFRGHPVWKKNQSLQRRYIRDREIKKEHLQRGVAYWQKTKGKDSDLYALHRYAPVNSIIAVTNPMKNRTVYVKVIGKMPESVYGSNVAVVLSSKAAKMLGAKDARFFVKVRYLK